MFVTHGSHIVGRSYPVHVNQFHDFLDRFDSFQPWQAGCEAGLLVRLRVAGRIVGYQVISVLLLAGDIPVSIPE